MCMAPSPRDGTGSKVSVSAPRRLTRFRAADGCVHAVVTAAAATGDENRDGDIDVTGMGTLAKDHAERRNQS